MGEKYTQEMHEEYRRKVDEQAAKEEEANRERMEKENARRAWLADGGREADFEKEWPKLRDEGRRQRVMDADRRARERYHMGHALRGYLLELIHRTPSATTDAAVLGLGYLPAPSPWPSRGTLAALTGLLARGCVV
jgi:hypothetical protein